MAAFEANKLACLRCPRASCAGACHCYDGKPVEAHALAGDCPDGLFTAAAGPAELWGDRLARMTARFGIDRLAAAWAKLNRRDCGCSARRHRLNEFHRRLLRRLSRNGS